MGMTRVTAGRVCLASCCIYIKLSDLLQKARLGGHRLLVVLLTYGTVGGPAD